MSTPEPCWAAAYGPGVPLHLEAGDTTLVDRFERTASAHPQRVALEFLGRKTTYAAMADRVSRVAEGLRRLGVGPGDSVTISAGLSTRTLCHTPRGTTRPWPGPTSIVCASSSSSVTAMRPATT